MLERVEAMELKKFGKVSVDTMEERVQALELATFYLEAKKGLLSLRMAELAKMHCFANLC